MRNDLHNPSSDRRPRRGATLMAALFCLAVVVMIAMALARSALLDHRQTVRREQELQSFWLAESAAERAAARLRIEAGYSGETWRPPGAPGPGAESCGLATIRVESLAAGGRRIHVEARYPEHGPWGIVSRKEFTIEP